MTRFKAISYKHHPIGSEQALARKLRVPVDELCGVAQRADDLYRGPILKTKRDGKVRVTYDAKPPLKRIHNRIQTEILRHVDFPGYLMGGLQDLDRTRGYIRNAQLHAGARFLVGEDAEDFFPSVTVERVRSIFQHVFQYPMPVSSLLAKICTRKGALVQGAITSTYLANLALYREEPRLQRDLSELGALYTRFVDDMHASTRGRVDATTRTRVVSLMRGTLERAGLRPKRKKQFIASAGSSMKVHQLNVAGTASKDQKYRRNLRAAVNNLELMAGRNEFSPAFENSLRSAISRVAGILNLNPGLAYRLKSRLSFLATQFRTHRRITATTTS
jgi:Reverse transcriptase (RNA-dependent DNA polymerase)